MVLTIVLLSLKNVALSYAILAIESELFLMIMWMALGLITEKLECKKEYYWMSVDT